MLLLFHALLMYAYFSSTERMPMGQALAQMPQAMHLLGFAPSALGMAIK